MREIKFRAWFKKTSKWLYNSNTEGCNILGETIIMGGWMYEIHLEDLNDVIVEQFTGLHDKNGKEIYEGDVVSCDSVFIVKWDEKHAMYKCYFVGLDEHYCNLSDDYIRDYFSVIGNIHENPELLNAR